MEPAKPSPNFLFVTCQIGAEPAVKAEIAARWPDFRFAYSRRGFLTFKVPSDAKLLADFDLESVFARAYGFSLGKVAGQDADELAEAVWEIYGKRPLRRLHVWERDSASHIEADVGPESRSQVVIAREAILRKCPTPETLDQAAEDPSKAAQPGDFVMDCVLVKPREWWIGYHRAKSVPSRWPGGMIAL